jgi:DNA-binding NtrC family response regulator
MERISPNAPITGSSRRRLARWLVGSPLSVVERDLVLETLAHTHGNRTLSAQLLGLSVRTLRNKITEYSGQGIDIPAHEKPRSALCVIGCPADTNVRLGS